MTKKGPGDEPEGRSHGTFKQFETKFSFDDLPSEAQDAIRDEIVENSMRDLPVEDILQEVIRKEIDDLGHEIKLDASEHFEENIHLPITLGVGAGLVVGGIALLIANQPLIGALIALVGMFSLYIGLNIMDRIGLSIREVI